MTRPSLLVAHPGAELYGADRVLLESATALATHFDVTVALPGPGPLVAASSPPRTTPSVTRKPSAAAAAAASSSRRRSGGVGGDAGVPGTVHVAAACPSRGSS